MENNEISMFVDVKLTTHDKRPDYLRFKQWTRSTVKVEAVKCFPCFLRITIVPENEMDNDDGGLEMEQQQQQQRSLNVPIIVPGVTVSLASSRTKQHTYGLFWKQNRRECFIYFGVDTEVNCRRYVKWVKRSIRNLESYRQMLIEQRRNSRGPVRLTQLSMGSSAVIDDNPLPDENMSAETELPHSNGGNNSWSRRASHISNIYEEICDGTVTPPRLSRRLSRASIASGIYEEMKSTNNSFNSISEETPEPPPLPPLPQQQRKRFNTFETDNCCTGLMGDIPRSNTNPECEMAKKKKYKKVLENIFGSGRSKRTKSVSESQTCSTEEVTDCPTPKHNYESASNGNTPIYANDATVAVVARKRHRQQLLAKKSVAASIADAKRNSFSSPDLSKINFLDTFAEEKFLNGVVPHDSMASSDDLDLSSHSLDESSILAANNNEGISTNASVADLIAQIRACHSKSGSLESLNISQQIPHNFNFSACNTSTINLMGAHVANNTILAKIHKPELKMDELSGYCFMAPIKKERESDVIKNSEMLMNDLADYCFMAPIKKKIPLSTVISSHPESSSSGYSTGSYCSSTSSCTNSTEDHLSQRRPSAAIVQPHTTPPSTLNEESVIYESMHLQSANASKDQVVAELPTTMTDFTGNLYENLLTVKAAQELEQMPIALTTSTPTDSPHTEVQSNKQDVAGTERGIDDDEEESFYQTPRKSIISIDDKVPSYYPNSCDTVKMRRFSQSQSPSSIVVTPNLDRSTMSGSNSVGLRQLVGIKTHRERKDSQYISSPQSILEQRHASTSSTCTMKSINETQKSSKSTIKSNKKTGTVTAAAHKISEHVYTVSHPTIDNTESNTIGKRKSMQKKEAKKDATQAAETAFNEELKEKLQKELITMAMLQNIDFKFDDTKALLRAESIESNKPSAIQNEGEEENYYKITASNGSRTINHFTEKYINMSPRHISSPPRTGAIQHPLKLNQEANQQTPISSTMGHQMVAAAGDAIDSPCSIMTQSKLEGPITTAGSIDWSSGVKKFASLPRFKKIDFSPLKLKINNVLQRNHQHTPQQQQQQF